MRKLLPADLVPDWEAVVSKLAWPATVRAEEVPLRDWIELARLADSHPLKDNPQRGDELFDVVDENDVVVGQETRDRVRWNSTNTRSS